MGGAALVEVIVATVVGFGLGLLFFGGLWWTVRRLATARHPALWVLGSFMLRVAAVLAVAMWLADGRWQRLVAVLVGFLAARVVVVRLMARGATRSGGTGPATRPAGADAPASQEQNDFQSEE
jgi:F1F0 ATPase subunit 2